MNSQKLSEVTIAMFSSGRYGNRPEEAVSRLCNDLGHRPGSKGAAIIELTLKNHIPEGAEECTKCKGTGSFRWMTQQQGRWCSGVCFECQGKGYTVAQDRERNSRYWRWRKGPEPSVRSQCEIRSEQNCKACSDLQCPERDAGFYTTGARD